MAYGATLGLCMRELSTGTRASFCGLAVNNRSIEQALGTLTMSMIL